MVFLSSFYFKNNFLAILESGCSVEELNIWKESLLMKELEEEEKVKNRVIKEEKDYEEEEEDELHVLEKKQKRKRDEDDENI